MPLADLATPMSIRVAATLGLADLTGTVGATAEQLAADTGTPTPTLRRLLNHLVTAEIFTLDNDGRYHPTPLGAQMSKNAPEGIKPLLDINQAGGRAELAFVDLLTTITTGTPAYPHRYGSDFWSDLDTHPHLRHSFDAQMQWRFPVQPTQIAENLNWSRFTEILDVGGGDGLVLTAILQAHPSLRGRVLELAPTTARFTAAGLSDRATVISGSFFDPLPTGADAYILSDILHDWDDNQARQILTNCCRAATPNGTVVVIEPGHETAGTAMDLFMLMCFGGQERTLDDLVTLAADSGLVLRSSSAVATGRTALEFTPRD